MVEFVLGLAVGVVGTALLAKFFPSLWGMVERATDAATTIKKS